jgi:hypothetical protein
VKIKVPAKMSLTGTEELEMEQAWLAHDPRRAVIPQAVWRTLRAIKRDLIPTAAVIENMLRDQDTARTVLGPMIRRRGMHRQHLLNELRKAMPAAILRISSKQILEIFWLSPKGPIIVDGKSGENQDCVLACYALAFPPDAKSLTMHSGWSLEISDHACARLLQRSPNGDLRAAAQQAALAFVAADASIVRPLIGSPASIYLPAGTGCFAATVIGGMTQTGKTRIYARCRTYVPATWLKPDQGLLRRAADVGSTVALKLWGWHRDGEAIPLST